MGKVFQYHDAIMSPIDKAQQAGMTQGGVLVPIIYTLFPKQCIDHTEFPGKYTLFLCTYLLFALWLIYASVSRSSLD